MRRTELIHAMQQFCAAAGVPVSEFDADFHVRMIEAMMVSYHKYGLVARAYPSKFEATSDVRARMAKYRETGDKHFLVDAANFAMIEAMHPAKANTFWGRNDVDTSPGRTTASGHRLVQEDNNGNRINPGVDILHHPAELEDVQSTVRLCPGSFNAPCRHNCKANDTCALGRSTRG